MTNPEATALLDERGAVLANELAAFISGLPADEQDVMLAILEAAASGAEVEGFGVNRVRVLAASVAIAAAAGVGAAGSALSSGGSGPEVGSAPAPSTSVVVPQLPATPAEVTPPVESALPAADPAPEPPAPEVRRPRQPRQEVVHEEPPVPTSVVVVEPARPEQPRPDLGNDVRVRETPKEETRYAPARSANTAGVTVENNKVATQTSSTNTDAQDPEISFEVTVTPTRPGMVVVRTTLRNTSDHLIRFGEINRLRLDVVHDGATSYVDMGEISNRVLRPSETLWFETTLALSNGNYEFSGTSLVAMH